ncbi:putative breast cancer type 2 susceptibility protein [Medicago truncatula]|uniref:Putative breast cancer type 2 susceptibility protein n=2 Tax=Medicago truncatula TaxID=3880 RepID=A0A396HR24_MEDTR|nr:putative breast cancer type 2 susceptibility protein [Medicago truncatula]
MIDDSFGFSNSLFKTASGRKVTLSSNGLVRAKTLLGLGLQEEIIDSNNHTPKNAKNFHGFDEESPPLVSKSKNGFENKIVQIESGSGSKKAPIKFQTPQSARSFNAFEEESPHLQCMKSCKMTSAASFQSPLVGRSNSGFENIIVQPDSDSGAKQAQFKFQTAAGRSLSISSDALKRARSLLGDPDLGDFFEGEDSLFLSLDMRQISKITSSVGHQKTPESNKNHVTKSFTYPLQPSKQTEFSNKLLGHEGNGNNLIMKFDDVANESDYGCKSSNTLEVVDLTRKSSSLGTTFFDVSSTTKTTPTFNKQPAIGKRRLGLTANVSSFKKPRISKTSASGDQHVQNFHNGLSKLSSGASGCKRKVSTRYPSRNARIHIKEFFAVPPLMKKVHFPNPVRQVTSGNAGEYIFHDGSDDNGIGGEAFIHLLAQHGASLHFASKEWVLNHYKWIVWKLACYERYYPARCAGKFLTVSNVLEELKYRYEREVNHGHRSIIKKVLEGDILPSSMMILCISSIHSNHVMESGTLFQAQTGNKSREAVKVELTDGWYSINAILDAPLSKQLDAGRLFVGQKLRIWGAELCGWNGPVSPFEVSSTISLFLHINGTYRVHWSARLGFCKVAGPPLAFKCIKNNGGLIPQTLAGITHIYPILYKERCSAVVDNIVSEYQKERTSSHVYDHDDSEGAKIYMMLETAAEPEFLMADMTLEQLRSFAAYKAKLNATRQSQLESSIEKALKDSGLGNRDVTPFMKLRVVGLTYKNRQDKPKEGIITIWNPTQKQCQELAEGEAYAIAGLTPYGSDPDVLHLQTRGSTTKWLPLSSNAKEQFRSFFNSRKSIP